MSKYILVNADRKIVVDTIYNSLRTAKIARTKATHPEWTIALLSVGDDVSEEKSEA